MRYLRKFNEGLEVKHTKWFLDFDKWVPECFEYMENLLNIVGGIDGDLVRNVDGYLYDILNFDKGYFSRPDIHIHKYKNLYKRIDDIEIYLADPSERIKQNKTASDLHKEYDELMKESIRIQIFYGNWLKLKKFDISVYDEIKDILEDICDSVECNYEISYMWYLDVRKPSYLYFEFDIYDSNGVISHNYFKEKCCDIKLDNKRIVTILEEISNREGVLKSLFCKLDKNKYSNGILSLKIKLGEYGTFKKI